MSGRRAFDSSRVRYRHVALHVMYDGTAYHGFARQVAPVAGVKRAHSEAPSGGARGARSRRLHEEGGVEEGDSGVAEAGAPPPAATPPAAPGPASRELVTVESVVFDALMKARLITSPAGAGYTRCGRTDRGVSAAAQVMAMRLRSKARRADVPHPSADAHASSPLPSQLDLSRAATLAERAEGAVPAHCHARWTREDGLANTGDAFPAPAEENDYALILNSLLPPDVRVMGWSDVADDFSARFSASTRVYRYYFVRRRLDVRAMQEAARRLQGVHDFRNFCKYDVENTQNFVREILSVRVCAANGDASAASAYTSAAADAVQRYAAAAARAADAARAAGAGIVSTTLADGVAALSPVQVVQPPPALRAEDALGARDVWYFEVVGRAFLWHQIRCIAAVLFHVGRGLEQPSVVDFLLDTRRCPARPQYVLAGEAPLCLQHCSFGEELAGTPAAEGARRTASRHDASIGGDGDSGRDGRCAAAGAGMGAGVGGSEEVEADGGWDAVADRPSHYARLDAGMYARMHHSPAAIRRVLLELERQWSDAVLKASLLRGMIDRVHALPMLRADVDAFAAAEPAGKARAASRNAAAAASGGGDAGSGVAASMTDVAADAAMDGSVATSAAAAAHAHASTGASASAEHVAVATDAGAATCTWLEAAARHPAAFGVEADESQYNIMGGFARASRRPYTRFEERHMGLTFEERWDALSAEEQARIAVLHPVNTAKFLETRRAPAAAAAAASGSGSGAAAAHKAADS